MSVERIRSKQPRDSPQGIRASVVHGILPCPARHGLNTVTGGRLDYARVDPRITEQIDTWTIGRLTNQHLLSVWK